MQNKLKIVANFEKKVPYLYNYYDIKDQTKSLSNYENRYQRCSYQILGRLW